MPPLPEGCFALLDVDRAAAPLVRAIRAQRPHVVVTYDENGGYPHPDHIMCHQVTVAAFELAGDPERYTEAGEPWQPVKLYYHQTFTKPRYQALHDGLLARGLDSPYAARLATWVDRPGDAQRVTTRVPCAEFFPVRDAALRAHATQVDPDGFWFACPLGIQQRVWPTEDYQLARSLVDTTIPEDDLFAGVRETLRAHSRRTVVSNARRVGGTS
jgi:mycothiol S-conjugate amidase